MPGDVEPGDELEGFVGLVVLVGAAPLVGERKQDRLDHVDVPGGHALEGERLVAVRKRVHLRHEELAQVLPVVLRSHACSRPVDGEVGAERVEAKLADVAVGVGAALGEFDADRL